jgi:hypothetical protein
MGTTMIPLNGRAGAAGLGGGDSSVADTVNVAGMTARREISDGDAARPVARNRVFVEARTVSA